MRKLIKITAVLMVVVVVLSACSPSDSVPSVKQIKNDILSNFEYVNSIEKIEITDTLNQKSTMGMLEVTMKIDYTNKDMESVHRDNASIFYSWDDDAGWKISTMGSWV